MSRPVLVFVHGAWHSPEYYKRVIAILEPLGYKCVALSMPSVGRNPPTSSLDEDIETIRSTVLAELDAGQDVIVNSHSWGGIPACSALDGLSKPERELDGKLGVVKLTFVTSFVLPEDVSLQDAIGGHAPDWWRLDEDGNMLADDPRALFYHDLDRSDGNYWISKLRPHSVASVKAKTKSAAWKRITSSYLICEDDKCVPVQGQEAMIEQVKKSGAKIDVERVFCGHSPHLVKPDIVANFIRRAAGENV